MLRSVRQQIRNLHGYYCVIKSNVSKISYLNLPRVGGPQKEFFHSLLIENNLSVVTHHPRRDSVRYKSKNKDKKRIQEDVNEEFSDDEEVIKEGEYDEDGGKVRKINVKSLRVDHVIKNGFKLTRRRVEESIFANKVKLNGKNIPKKSFEVRVGDVFEMYEESTDGDVSNKTLAKFAIKKIEPVLDPFMYFVYISDYKS